MLRDGNLKTRKSINNANYGKQSGQKTNHLIITFICMLALITHCNSRQYFYYPVSFNAPDQYYFSIVPQNQTLTVTLQFSQNFTQTVLQYTQLDFDSNLIAKWNQTVTNLPYNFTKFYLTWTQLRVVCYPSILNPNITINFNFYIDDALFAVRFLNFLSLVQNEQMFLGQYIEYNNQIIEIYPQQCVSSWQGWKVGIKFANGTKMTQINNQVDTFCTAGNIKSQPARYYYLENKTTIYPYLFKFDSSANLPSAYSFFMRYYIRNSKNCIGQSYSSGNSLNQTHCICAIGFVWNSSYDRCERDCSLYQQTNGLIAGSAIECACLDGKQWNYLQLQCKCSPNLYLDIFSRNCYRNCSLDVNSNGLLVNGSNIECQCIQGYNWNEHIQGCVLDCSQIVNSDSDNTILTPISECKCLAGFKWNNARKCLKDCQIVQFSTKQQPQNPETISCQCIQQYTWDAQSNICKKLDSEPSFLQTWWGISAVAVGVVTIIASAISIGVIIKKMHIIKRITRVSPQELGERTQQALRIESMKIMDFYQ